MNVDLEQRTRHGNLGHLEPETCVADGACDDGPCHWFHSLIKSEFHGRLERYATDMMIKLMPRGFAPVAIALSFVAGNADRSGDELSIVESFSDTARYFRGYYDTCSHDMRASTAAPAAA
jgi:hypothetical protein